MTGPADILRKLEQAAPSDRELLARFANRQDQEAFAELVRRHGRLVLGVCRRALGHAQDAEDAFQAVFLILARKAGRLGQPDLLGNWLHGVAVRVASRARRSAARRRAREVVVSTMPDPPADSAPIFADDGPILDEELAALPAWYREAILLCDMRGVSREEAAVLLGVPEGTLSSRLANGRKKLAARLARRGVSLSVAALLGTIGQADAAVMVPTELVAKTCGLVADISAGAAVPNSLARLVEGGFPVPKTLLFGVLVVASAAGVVVAAGVGDDPKHAAPPKAGVVARAEQDPQPKAKEKWTLTTQPRLRVARDYGVRDVNAIAWSPDGKMLAFQGFISPRVDGQRPPPLQSFLLLDADPFNPSAARPNIALAESSQLVGFTPDGKELLTATREYQLVSGFHKLQYITLFPAKGGSEFASRPGRVVELDADDTQGYSFVADGKTYRTISTTSSSPGVYAKVRVTEVDPANGKTLKSLMEADGAFVAFSLSPNGKRLGVLAQQGDVTVYDVLSGKPIWSKATKMRPNPNFGNSQLVFSADAARLLLTASQQSPAVFNVVNGEQMPGLESVELINTIAAALSADGRVLFISGDHSSRLKVGGITAAGRYMSVWDTDSGKLLKRWANRIPSQIAFHPTQPILAILEPNGENTTRLGLWDFSAEVEKK